ERLHDGDGMQRLAEHQYLRHTTGGGGRGGGGGGVCVVACGCGRSCLSSLLSLRKPLRSTKAEVEEDLAESSEFRREELEGGCGERGACRGGGVEGPHGV